MDLLTIFPVRHC